MIMNGYSDLQNVIKSLPRQRFESFFFRRNTLENIVTAIFYRQVSWIIIGFLALGLPFGVKENLNQISLAMSIFGYILYASCFIFYIKGYMFSFDDLNGSLINIKEAIEDLPDQDSPHVKKLRRMYDRTPHISGCGMFGVER